MHYPILIHDATVDVCLLVVHLKENIYLMCNLIQGARQEKTN